METTFNELRLDGFDELKILWCDHIVNNTPLILIIGNEENRSMDIHINNGSITKTNAIKMLKSLLEQLEEKRQTERN